MEAKEKQAEEYEAALEFAELKSDEASQSLNEQSQELKF